jgi:RND superfamily putative drug exporter
MSVKNWTARLARGCARRPWVTITVWIAAVALAVVLMSTFLGDALVTETEIMNNPESSAALDLMNERLAIEETYDLEEMIIVRSETLTVDDAEFSEQVGGIYADLATLGRYRRQLCQRTVRGLPYRHGFLEP